MHTEIQLLNQQAELLGKTNNLVALFDDSDQLSYANSAFRETYFIGADEHPSWREIMCRNFEANRGAYIQTDDFETWLVTIQSRRGKVGHRAFEADLHCGRWLWMTETVGPTGWMLCIAFDITSLRVDERGVRQALNLALRDAETDPLTGVANRRYVMKRIDDLLEMTAAAEKVPPYGCLAILDIDNFKSINDRYGHDVGDQVIKHFTSKVTESLRMIDCVGRIGGEEFALVMPGINERDAVKVLNRLLGMIQVTSVNDTVAASYTFSAGIASVIKADSRIALYRRADQALLMAKEAGKNRCMLFSEQAALAEAPTVATV